ncbi:MAG TPA: GNAT family N-acetyltransferase [Candidatus Limnocylindrales bacterium]|jgi:ribosomal protein S18 acetylase RimI-like enzyme
MADVRPMVTADTDAVVALLTHAFHDDPGIAIIEPEASRRDAASAAFFRPFLMASLDEATAAEVVGSSPIGAAIWYGPDRYGPSETGLAAAFGASQDTPMTPEAFGRLVGFVGQLDGLHARLMSEERHHRLDFLGVDPAHQGQGIGGQLLDAGIARAEAARLPIYLETMRRDPHPTS